MLDIALLLTATFTVIAASRWRIGIYLAILTAFLQDPMRKLTPGEPIYFNLLCGIVFAGAAFGAIMSRVSLSPKTLVGWRKYLMAPFAIFISWVLFEAGRSLVNFGQPLVPVLGLINYVAPFFGLMIYYQFFARGGPRSVLSVFRFYVISATVALVTVYLQSAGLNLPVFGEVGEGIHINEAGGILQANSGIFRASEIAAWHAGTAICVAILLMTIRKVRISSLLGNAFLVAVLLAIGILTGRRKFLVMVAIFAVSYISMIFLYEKRRRASAIATLGAAGVAYFVGAAFLQDSFRTLTPASGSYSDYVVRMSTTFSAVPTRFVELGIAPVSWAYAGFGLLGAGLGIGTQGVTHIAPIAAESVAPAEGGLGKLTLELGVPGLFIVAYLGIAMIRHIGNTLKYVAQISEPLTRLGCGLVALLLANAATFSVATQTYGDVFVLLFLGLVLGALMALPVLATLRAQAGEPSQRRQMSATVNVIPASIVR